MFERARAGSVIVALILSGCASQATPGPSATPTPAPTQTSTATASPSSSPAVTGSLGEALAFAGPIPRSIDFTNWAAVRASVGAEDLTGASAFEDKARAIRNEATLAGFGVRDLRTHAADWGFDVFDLDWEVAVQSTGLVLWVLRPREEFDPASLTDKLEAYGFATEQLPRGVLWTGTLGVLRQGTRILNNTAFLNTGLLDDGRTLVLSFGGADEVRAIMTDGPQPVADLSVLSVARLLDGPTVASIRAGDSCVGIAQAYAGLPVDELLAAAGPLGHYNALAAGYRRAPATTGRIVMGYPEVGQAEADLAGRRSLAENGISAASGVRYAERFFVLADARVEDRAIVLDLAPVALETPTPNPSAFTLVDDFLPRFLITMISRRDVLFATCSE